jgi:hypothetical protein
LGNACGIDSRDLDCKSSPDTFDKWATVQASRISYNALHVVSKSVKCASRWIQASAADVVAHDDQFSGVIPDGDVDMSFLLPVFGGACHTGKSILYL